MSGVVVLAPIVAAAAWPAVVSAASAVMVAMGYAAVQVSVKEAVGCKVGLEAKNEVEIELANAEEISAAVGREETLTFVKDDITVKFSRDVRGRMRVCVEGDAHPKAELEVLGRELAGRVLQQYAYTRIVTEMQAKTGMSIVDQSVDEDETIRIKLRSWE